MRADRVEGEEHEDERVGEPGQREAPVRERENQHDEHDERVLERPVRAMARTDREDEPEDGEERGEARDIRIPDPLPTRLIHAELHGRISHGRLADTPDSE